MVLHPQLQECFHSGELPAGTARVNCWNNSTTSKSPQRKRRRDITASGLNFRSPCLLCHPPTSSSLKNGAAWHVLGGGAPVTDDANVGAYVAPRCAEFTLGAKLPGGADGGLSSKTCPPSQTKKHSLPQRHGANPAHLGIITRHLLKFDIMLAYWGVWCLR